MYQKIIIVGNLGGDPEMRYLPDGKAVTNFSVATNRKYKKIDETTWFRVSAWDKQAENCNQYLKKGQMVVVQGEMQEPRVYEKDGEWRSSGLELRAQRVIFGPKATGGNGNGEYQAETVAQEDDVPF